MVGLRVDRTRAARVRTVRACLMMAAYAFLVAAALCAHGADTEKSMGDVSSKKLVNERRKQTRRVYSLLDHSLRICMFAFLSAVFAGLTLGVMCANTFTLEIIAESGPQPDCTYAATVLPLRKQGHKTLCTLIISNMLCNVLIVQELGDVFDVIESIKTRGSVTHVVDDSGSSLYKFIVSTLIIVIFAEILPMSICRSKYSLRVAAAGSIFVKVAMILTYPVSAPLGWFLDKVIGSEETGLLYDKKELRKLMVVHYEREGELDATMATSELNLLLAAMDFHERKVGDIMTPIAETTYVQDTDFITPDFVERLWMSGRSRVPVESAPGVFENILVVKDLMTVNVSNEFSPLTVAQVVKAKDRLFAVVCANTPLPAMLKFFLEAQTHMAVVFEEVTNASSATGPGFVTDLDSTYRSSAPHRSFGTTPPKIIGIVTMEDVVEELISSEIYDEYDRYDPVEHATRYAPVNLPGNGKHPHQLNVPREPEKPPRVNFYSYFTHPTAHIPLTEAQVWAVAYFLNRTVECFYAWQPPYIKLLLDECKDLQLSAAPDGTTNSSAEVPLNSPPEQSMEMSRSATSSLYGSRTNNSTTNAIFRGDHAHFLNKAADEAHILYTRGIRTDKFLLVLGGSVELLVGSENFRSKLQSFNYIGEEALTKPFFVPDFSAVVMTAARVYCIPREIYDKYQSYQAISRHRNSNVRILGPNSSAAIRRTPSRANFTASPAPEKEALLGAHDSGHSHIIRGQRQQPQPYGTFTSKKTL
jgi:metal transporter CNNM